jgi:hypothetical protein
MMFKSINQTGGLDSARNLDKKEITNFDLSDP